MSAHEAYQELLERAGELADIGAAVAILGWDQETYMPPGAQAARGQQLATINAIAHRKLTDDAVGELLERLQGDEAPEEEDARIAVERMAWNFRQARKIPESLVKELARAQSDSVGCWTTARPENDFKKWLPYFERVMELEGQRAECLREGDQPLYDALHGEYERGSCSRDLQVVFSELRDAVVPLLHRITDSPYQVPTAPLEGCFDEKQQWDFGVEVLEAMGFDFDLGRQDRAAHPFTTAFHPTDVRITTRIFKDNFRSGFFSSVHEGGHGLYELGIAERDWRTPLGSSISLGIHESQSRMWENMVGRSLPFWKAFYPRLCERFPENFLGIPLEDFHRSINEVRPSLIRVEADEVTYSLHIILRFELECAMLEGRLAPADVPEAWREKVREYLGLDVPNDADGCMQDIHWAWGLVGYFPTYTLGNLYSAQFFNQALVEIDDLEGRIAGGDLMVLTEWLREKIHRVGMRRMAGELLGDVTGESLSAKPFIEYLETKYADIYRLG